MAWRSYRHLVDRHVPVITDQPEARRFVARLGSELAGFIDYRRLGDRLILVHTEVPAAFEGRGIASVLAHDVLDGARARQDRVSIRCPYLDEYVRRHPEFAPAADGRIPMPAGA
ncbi:MAG: N-acetyltransferase [Chloroflexi bacterium]|nr:N-acetyltransferase [Chloroflexota bacterium]